jgi:hypothetical protein
MFPVFIISLVMLRKRKDFQPLKSRSVLLLTISTIGNFIYFTTLIVAKILDNNILPVWNNLTPRPITPPGEFMPIKDSNYPLFVMI